MSALARESRVFARYLLGRPVGEEVLRSYEAAVQGGAAGPHPEPIAFDRLVAALARATPALTRLVDMYSRHFRRTSPVRKRLILMLAILESHAPLYAELDRVDRGGKAVMYARMAFTVLGSGLLLLLGVLLLTPMRLVLAGRPKG